MTNQIQMIDYQNEMKIMATVLSNEIARYKMVCNQNLASDRAYVLQVEIDKMEALLDVYASVLE